jgi:hypothetical protein
MLASLARSIHTAQASCSEALGMLQIRDMAPATPGAAGPASAPGTPARMRLGSLTAPEAAARARAADGAVLLCSRVWTAAGADRVTGFRTRAQFVAVRAGIDAGDRQELAAVRAALCVAR